MRVSKGVLGLLRLIGVVLMFVAIRLSFPALIPPSKKLAADFGDTTHAWASPGRTLVIAGLCLVIAITCFIAGSLLDDDPNQALELTATRRAFTFQMTKKVSTEATLPVGGGSSSCSR